MNATELLAVLNVPKNKETLNHATRLLAIYSLLRSIKNDVTGAEVTEITELFVGKKTEVDRWHELRTINEGYKMPAEKITVKTSYGEYNFTIPIENDFHSLVCNMLQIDCEQKKEVFEVIETFEIEKTVLGKIKIAAKYAAAKFENQTPPCFYGVLINIKNEWAEVVGSDCIRIFVSEKLVTDSEDRQILIAPASFKAIAGIVPVGDFVQVDILKTEGMLINGVKTELMSEFYANYRTVIPDYNQKMVFNRIELISNVSKALNSANMRSHLVRFHLNGNIEITAQDIDFGLASVSSMDYEIKEFGDLDIGFNGLLIQEVLKGFKSENISMMTDGNAGHAAIFTDGIDTSLLMPMAL